MSELAPTLEWKYGLVANTKYDVARGRSVITSWRHESIPEPDEAQLDLDMAEYEVYKTAKDAQDAADAAQIAQDLTNNLPDWATVNTAIDAISDLAEAKVFIKKLTKVVYGHIKGTSA